MNSPHPPFDFDKDFADDDPADPLAESPLVGTRGLPAQTHDKLYPAYRPRQRRDHPLLRFLSDHNPFYLLSAVCMLAGCLALTNSLSWSPINLDKLLVLVLTLNLYEGLLIALAVFLVRRRGLARDALWLLLIEALFLVDVTFLNAEIFSLNVKIGLAVNAAVLIAGVVKVYAIFLAADLASGPLLLFAVAQLAVLFAFPGIFAWLDKRHEGVVSPAVVYAAWWVTGSLPLLYNLIVPRHAVGLSPPHVRPLQRAILPAMLVLPFLSITAHLGTSNWIYKVQFNFADLAPIALACAIVLKRVRPSDFIPQPNLSLLQGGLPVLAIILSADHPQALVVRFAGGEITPAKLTVEAAYLTYVYCFFVSHALSLVPAGIAMFAAMVFGPRPASVRHFYVDTWDRGATAGRSFWNAVIPDTTAGWGVLSVIGSFVLLGIGAAISLLKGPLTGDDRDMSDDARKIDRAEHAVRCEV